ncbi:tol-pal system-associated acyl-CoA thioesterase [Geminicoccus roseus]|uniref:tol-pal system-associated acyl-CoA thioesterase n=1 Tax=Geminicoccus roseus TaxID=404900 RepID=UPI000422B7D6|nr:tol-pal system-associated acyl-CoA thioesterase [Geminicoccus roseus]
MTGVHAMPLRVYYEDTDAGGIVYHANYLRFAERARTEWLRTLGFDHPGLLETFGVMFTVRRCDAVFLVPARLDDELRVETRVARIEGVRIHLDQVVLLGERRLVTVAVELVLVDRRVRPVRPPAALRSLLEPMAEP